MGTCRFLLTIFAHFYNSWDEEIAQQIGPCYEYVMSCVSKTLQEFVVDGASPSSIAFVQETVSTY